MKWQFFVRTEWAVRNWNERFRLAIALFREGFGGEGWSGEEQGERRDGEETRKPHVGT
jgi:hypothetical protein